MYNSGSSIRVKKLIFKKSQLSAQIGDCEPVEVKSLVLPQRIVEVKSLQNHLLDAKMHPPGNRYVADCGTVLDCNMNSSPQRGHVSQKTLSRRS
jgi:hypothetical protein